MESFVNLLKKASRFVIQFWSSHRRAFNLDNYHLPGPSGRPSPEAAQTGNTLCVRNEVHTVEAAKRVPCSWFVDRSDLRERSASKWRDGDEASAADGDVSRDCLYALLTC
jgi:hypothetical protein